MKQSKIILAVLMAVAASTLSAKTKIVATIFPEYDWTRAILDEKSADAELTLLLDSGTDLHSFQPTVKDMAKIGDADIFIYVGGESDQWVSGVLKNVASKNLTTINLLESLGSLAREEELVDGMEAEHDDDDEEEDEEEIEYDEHVWLSLKNAKILCGVIADALCQKDAKNAAAYRANLAAYTAQLEALDAAYEKAVSTAEKKLMFFGDRFPFRYLADDYGIKYYAAFSGCSAETEASFKTVAFLAERLKENDLTAVLQIEKSSGKLPAAIIRTSRKKNVRILTMDSMQATTMREIRAGATYLGAMQKNLETLTSALNR